VVNFSIIGAVTVPIPSIRAITVKTLETHARESFVPVEHVKQLQHMLTDVSQIVHLERIGTETIAEHSARIVQLENTKREARVPHRVAIVLLENTRAAQAHRRARIAPREDMLIFLD
jgi:ABC-type hemin transport system substrate-binding protein